MAAITPFLEQQAVEPEWDEEFEYYPQEGSGLGAAKAEVPPLAATHAALVKFIWGRQAAEEALRGNGLRIIREGNSYMVELEKPLDTNAVPWSPLPSTGRRYEILTWTSKMAAPSWSLPAGPVSMGGACPGAEPGQSVVSAENRRAAIRKAGRTFLPTVNLPLAICQQCYATKANYAMGGTIVAQIVRYAWVRASLASGEFVEIMSDAVARADYLSDGATKKVTDEEGEETRVVRYGPELEQTMGDGSSRPRGSRYFRVHDSGDFFSPAYYRAWIEIARRNPDVLFWAPTRVWVIPRYRELIARENIENLVVRPSGYHVGDAAPRIEGWPDAGSTSLLKYDPKRDPLTVPTGPMRPELDATLRAGLRKQMGAAYKDPPYRPMPPGEWDDRADWHCQTYAVLDMAHSCRNAVNPDGRVGCRMCWTRSAMSVNYATH